MEEALTNAGILKIILSYEGSGSWLFIPPVSKLWKQCYEQLDVAPLQRCYPEAHVTIRLTAYGAAFRSLSRFQMACKHGLQAYFATQVAQERAGAWCDVSTLLAAQKLGLEVTDSYIEYAAASGRLDVLKLLHTDQEVKLPTDVSSYAAAHDHMDVLQWLQEVGFAFTEKTINVAAATNNAALLQWLLEQDCPRDEMRLCVMAAFCGHTNILFLLAEHGLLPAPQRLTAILRVAGAQDQLTAAQWLRQRGAEWPALLQFDGRPWQGEVLAWARAEGCTAPTEVEAAEEEVEEEEEEEQN
eukprot:4029-Heterococcus_DN1.PRE.3